MQMSYQQLPPPQGTPYPGPAPKQPRPYDPLAVALGNASLLGLGYFLIRRWIFGILGLVGTAVLVVLLYQHKDVWYEIGLLAWWILQIAHGWFVAHRQPNRAASLAKRLVALGITIPVLVAVGFVRYDASRVAGQVADGREAGDCAKVTKTQDQVWLGDRVVAGRQMDRGDLDVEACATLEMAAAQLHGSTVAGDVQSLQVGFGILAKVIADPRQERTGGAVMDEFVGDLQSSEPCPTISLTAWLRARTPTRNLLDRPNAVIPRIEPNALLACADGYASHGQWVNARTTYQRLVTSYPKARQAIKAHAGIQRATLTIELDNVRELVSNAQYCSSPARYSGATPYHRGLNRAVFLGEGAEYTDQLPGQWGTDDPYRATVIVCTDTPGDGEAVQTCPYTPTEHPEYQPSYITFRKITVPVKVYELRTARLVSSATVEITGTSCPQHWTDTSGLLFISGESRSTSVEPSGANIQAAFRPLVVRP
jgi:hypothetical protein